MADWHGPWKFRNLIHDPVAPLPESHGAYVISIAADIYDTTRHGASRFIYVGGMKAGQNSSLAKRVGEWFAATFGFMPYHGPGKRFFAQRKSHGLSPWALELWWCEHQDPKCLEKCLLDSYRETFNSRPLMNKRWEWKGCSEGPHEIEVLAPWHQPEDAQSMGQGG